MFSKIRILVQKLHNLFGGRGGGHQKITLDYRGEGGRSRESKKGLRNVLMVPDQIPSEENSDHAMTSPDPHNHITLIECSG